MNCSISCAIIPEIALGCYYPELKQTNTIWETVCIGYRALVIFHYPDHNSTDSVLFGTEKQAKKYLSVTYCKPYLFEHL